MSSQIVRAGTVWPFERVLEAALLAALWCLIAVGLFLVRATIIMRYANGKILLQILGAGGCISCAASLAGSGMHRILTRAGTN